MKKVFLYLLFVLVLFVLWACNSDSEKLDVVVSNDDIVKESLLLSLLTIDDPDNNYTPMEKIMLEMKVSTPAKKVQYDMVNNLDKEFLLVGNLNLCDYYNYGYKNEKEFFCATIDAIDEKDYSEKWYLYFHRDSYKELFKKLMDENDVFSYVVAEIPREIYKSGQDNMALVIKAKY